MLDASALLAYLTNEIGSDIVAEAISSGAAISMVNLAEVLSTLASRGSNPADIVRNLTDRGLLGVAITVESFTTTDCIETAQLRALTRSLGLSLADRACLALARRLTAPVLTADHVWTHLTLDVDVRLIRATTE